MLETFFTAKLQKPTNPVIPLNEKMELFLDPQDPELLGEDSQYMAYISKMRNKKQKKKFPQPTHKEPVKVEEIGLDIYIPKSNYHTFYYKDPAGIFDLFSKDSRSIFSLTNAEMV